MPELATLLPPACEAKPLDARGHDGPVTLVTRICAAGHSRTGYACQNCAGPYGAVFCPDCADEKPALLVPAHSFRQAAALTLADLIDTAHGLLGDAHMLAVNSPDPSPWREWRDHVEAWRGICRAITSPPNGGN